MPFPSHRLDLCLVLPTPMSDEVADAASTFVSSHAVVEGGMTSFRVERGEGERFWANQQGGFRVTCPQMGGNLAPVLGKALGAWRAGGERSLQCEHCGRVHDLAELRYAPQAAFGASALVLCDVATLSWLPAEREALESILGPFTVVARRIG